MNPLLVVRRIECPVCTTGPYNCNCETWRAREKLDLRDRHSTDFFLQTRPGMWVDFPREHRERMESYYSGFKSREQMLYWFTKDELSTFKRGGFKLAIYIADDWYEGYSKSQVFFVRPTVWRKGELPDG